MRVWLSLPFFVFFLVFPVFMPDGASGSDKKWLDDHKTLLDANRFKEADNLLERVLAEAPENAEIHFSVGKIYVEMEQDGKADKVFSVLLGNLNGNYSRQISELYLTRGVIRLDEDCLDAALQSFDRALAFDPEIVSTISTILLDYGEQKALSGNIDAAKTLLGKAYAINKAAASRIHEIFFRTGMKADNETCMAFFNESRRYGHFHDEQIAEKIVEIAEAKSFSKVVRAASAPHEPRMDFEESTAFGPGEKLEINLAAGETTEIWIHLVEDTVVKLFASRKEVEVEFRGGKIVKTWLGEKLPAIIEEDFKVRARDSVYVRLEFSSARKEEVQ